MSVSERVIVRRVTVGVLVLAAWILGVATWGTASAQATTSTAGPPDAASVDDDLRAVFAAPDYAGLESEEESTFARIAAASSLFDQFWAWVGGLIGRLRLLRGTAPLAYWAILIGLLIVLTLLIWHIVYTLRVAFGAPAADDEAEDVEARRRRRSVAFLSDADDEAARGSFGAALRSLLLAAFARYAEDRESLVPMSKTNREVVNRLPLDAEAAAELRWLVGSVDRSWYGSGPADRADFDRARAAVAPMLR